MPPTTGLPMPHTRRLLDLAAAAGFRALGRTAPNPLVGAVIARHGSAHEPPKILGIGHHRVFGGLHAEREAIIDCARRGHDPAGATLYVTLEPCAHTGKQPPCVEAVVQAGIARVVYARSDPGVVSGGGARLLCARGVEAGLSLESPRATHLSDPFVKSTMTRTPWVIAKWAQTIDGRAATREGHSQWISSPAARRRVHHLRGMVDAVLTGVGTVLADDPLLTPRLASAPRRVPVRVVVDPSLKTPEDSRLICTARDVPVMIACSRAAVEGPASEKAESLRRLGVQLILLPAAPMVPRDDVPARDDRGSDRAGTTEASAGLDLQQLLRVLHDEHGAAMVLVESGPRLLGSLLDRSLVDEAIAFVAPMVLADDEALPIALGRRAARLDQAVPFSLVKAARVGPDVMLWYRRPFRADLDAVR